MRVKFGVDPTSSSLHVGHLSPIQRLRQFQQTGAVIILVVGDVTARIGDPSGQRVERPVLTPQEITNNGYRILAQVQQLLSWGCETHWQSEWYPKMDLLSLLAKATTAQMLEREDFRKRMQEGQPLRLDELVYPLLQGWDSVEVKADVEVGGEDQLLNLLVGRDMQRDQDMPPQTIVTVPLLLAGDGRKMGKSLGNLVSLAISADDLFGKMMAIQDEQIVSYGTIAAGLNREELERRLKTENPRDVKMTVAEAIVRIVHGEHAAYRVVLNWPSYLRARKQKD